MPFSSRPSRARGLKQNLGGDMPDRYYFASITGAWIETMMCVISQSFMISRPSRARGLKQSQHNPCELGRGSRPSRARGLKLDSRDGVPWGDVRVHHGRVD